MKKYIKSVVYLSLGLSFFVGLVQSDGVVKTPAEAVNYGQYSQYEEISHFLSLLDSLSEELTVQIVGKSLGTEEY